MKTPGKVFILLIAMALVLVPSLSCLETGPQGPEGDDVPGGAPRIEGTPQSDSPEGDELGPLHSLPSPRKLFKDIHENCIDYSNPELYLTLGSQSNLNEQYLNEVNQQIRIGNNNDMESIRVVFCWKQSYFKTYSAGGKSIGKVTVNDIMKEKELSGCHDHGLVLVSILRRYGFPAIMVDTAGIQWALDYSEGKREGFRGHVFVEVYVKDKWILINSTSGEYVENYDPYNPVISITDSVESKGYFALLKGLDPDGYGINSNEQLTECLKAFARRVKSAKMSFPPYEIKRLLQ